MIRRLRTLSILKLALIVVAALALWLILPLEARALDGPHAGFGGCDGCHNPHRAIGGPDLLWSRNLSTKNISWSDTTQTSSGTTLPTNIKTWTGTSKYCFSCHDGTLSNNPFDFQQITPTSVDMKRNHAVAVPYPFNGVANTYNSITTYGLSQGAAVPGWVANPTSVKIYSDPIVAGPNNRGI